MSKELEQQPRKRNLLDLVQHVAYLEDTEGAVPDELLAEFREEVRDTLLAKGEKVDNYAKLIHYFTMRAAAAKGELEAFVKIETERLKKRITRAEADARRLGDFALFVIDSLGRDNKGKRLPLEGVNYTLTAAGVADSCEVTDESLVPLEFKTVELTARMPGDMWNKACIADFNEKDTTKRIAALQLAVLSTSDAITFNCEYAVDKKKLLAALKEPCEACSVDDGCPAGKTLSTTFASEENPEGIEMVDCPKCGGTGKRRIPGARLLTNKTRLVVK